MAVRSVVFRLEAQVDRFRSQMRNAGDSVSDAADRMTDASAESRRMRGGLTELGNTAGKVGLVAAAGLGMAAKAAMDWESAWTGVTKTVDGTVQEMAALEGGLRDLAKSLPATHDEIAGVAEAAGQLGVAREDILGFTKTMIDLSETTNVTADEAATAIAQISNVMGTMERDGAEGVERFASTLVALGNAGASTEKEILSMAQRLGGAGKLVGASEGEVLALSNALASMGIEAELGGGSMSRTMTKMYSAAKEGGRQWEDFAKVAGMSAQAFSEEFEASPIKAVDSLVQGLNKIDESGGNAVGALADLGIRGTQDLQVLLRLKGAGDLLTDSLDLQATAWAENVALSEEAEKRYGTTASQVQVAWNQIKDAGIEAGEALLPVISGVAGAVGGLASAFGQLPGPVQKVATGMAGMTAVLGGGLWFTASAISGVSNMRGALQNLGASGTTATRAMKGVGIAAGGLVALTLAVQGIKALQEAMEETQPSLDSMRAQLLSMATDQTGKSFGSISAEFDTLGGAIDRIADKGFSKAFSDNMMKPFFGLEAGSLKVAKEEIEGLDAALASFAMDGHADVAAAALDELATREGLTAGQTKALMGMLPEYGAQLDAIETEARLASGATDGLEGSSKGLAGSLAEAEAQAEAFKSTLESLNAMLSGRSTMRDYEASIDDFTESLKESGRTFDITTEKGRANQAALDGIAASALSVAEGMDETSRKRFLTTAIKDLRTMAEGMGLPKSEIRVLIAALKEANGTNVKPKIEADTRAASSALGNIMAQLAAIDGNTSTATITTIRREVVSKLNPFSNARQDAEGGPIYGPGSGTSDSIPAWLSNGEYVVKAAAVQKYGTHMFDGLNAMKYATGGKVAPKKKVVRLGLDSSERELTGAEVRAAEALERQLDILGKTLAANTDKLGQHQAAVDAAAKVQGDWADKMAATGAASVAGFNTGLFDVKEGSVWDSADQGSGGWLDNLTADLAGLAERSALQSQLSSAGLTGDALAAALAQGSNADLTALLPNAGQFQELFNQRAAAAASTSAEAGMQAYGREYAAASAATVALQKVVAQGNEVLGNIKHEIAGLSGSIGKVVALELNNIAADAGRSGRSGRSGGRNR